MSLKEQINEYIHQKVVHSVTQTKYREPVIGYCDVSNPLFASLQETIHLEHLKPQDILPEAKSVIAFFLPFTKEVIDFNRTNQEVAREWAVAYAQTNALLYDICQGIKEILIAQGYKCGFVEPTHNFDTEVLVAPWSHKHIAYIAGIGKFGLNRQLITTAGCAGRVCTIVTDAELAGETSVDENHLHEMCANCGWCQNVCPVGALGKDRWDKHLCWERLQVIEKQYADVGMVPCCGKCVIGPCAILA